MTTRKPRSAASPPDPEVGTEALRPEPHSEPGDGRTTRSGPGRAAACGLDPFTAFTEWSGPADESDYADLRPTAPRGDPDLDRSPPCPSTSPS